MLFQKRGRTHTLNIDNVCNSSYPTDLISCSLLFICFDDQPKPIIPRLKMPIHCGQSVLGKSLFDPCEHGNEYMQDDENNV